MNCNSLVFFFQGGKTHSYTNLSRLVVYPADAAAKQLAAASADVPLTG